VSHWRCNKSETLEENVIGRADVMFSVFTKPWRGPLAEVVALVRELGFDGVELPVRPGYPVDPENVQRELPLAARLFADAGLGIFSVAGPTDEATIATCAAQGIPMVRIMVPVGPEGYLSAEARARRELDALLPLLERYQVTVGVQNHNGRFVSNAMGLHHLLEPYDPTYVAEIWDAAHTALNGE
jgi:sugar phosphate isomerase/epimerase